MDYWELIAEIHCYDYESLFAGRELLGRDLITSIALQSFWLLLSQLFPVSFYYFLVIAMDLKAFIPKSFEGGGSSKALLLGGEMSPDLATPTRFPPHPLARDREGRNDRRSLSRC